MDLQIRKIILYIFIYKLLKLHCVINSFILIYFIYYFTQINRKTQYSSKLKIIHLILLI